jgi:hypothetical protein
VLVAARDLIHQGSRLLTHPLYGNFLPNQQPFRTLVLSVPQKGSGVDLDSVTLIEDAISVFRKYEGRWALPGQLRETVEKDYAMIDFDLMQESLRQYGFRFPVESQ